MDTDHSPKIHIRLASDRINPNVSVSRRTPRIYTPGQIITEQNEFMRLVYDNHFLTY